MALTFPVGDADPLVFAVLLLVAGLRRASILHHEPLC